MLRELIENEMMMVSGGAEDEVVVTGTIQRRTSPSTWDQHQLREWSRNQAANSFGGDIFGGGGGGVSPVPSVPRETIPAEVEYDPCAELDRLEEATLGPIDDVIGGSPSKSIGMGILAVFSGVGHVALGIRRIEHNCN